MQAPISPVSAFGGGAADTVMHPVVAIAMVGAILCILGLPRKYKIVPFLLAVFLLPAGQQLYLVGVHLYVPRILILFGLGLVAFAKLRSKKPVLPGGWNDLDKIFTCWVIMRALAVILLNSASAPALINQAAFLLDALGGYYFLRFLIRDTNDIARITKAFAVIVGVLGATMLYENFRGLNVFGYFGSVPIAPAIREGKIRSQGPFAHSILAGTFGAIQLALFIWLISRKRDLVWGVVGIIGCTAMVFSSSSSTPLITYISVFAGLCFWPLRAKMRTVRWVLLASIVALHLVMKAPVWFLIARVDLIAGNSGWDRAMLIDTFIKHFKDWWLIGTNQQATWGFDMGDLCQQFVNEGEVGGLATFICFIVLIARGFAKVGEARKLLPKNSRDEWLLWLIGVALFSNCVAFFGISYFDQTKFAWYTALSVISVASLSQTRVLKRREAENDQAESKQQDNEADLIASYVSL